MAKRNPRPAAAFVPGIPSIMCDITLQRWGGPGNDRAETIGESRLDATSIILALPHDRIAAMEDHDYTTDFLCEELTDHAGPHEVTVCSSVAEFFRVQSVGDITPAMLDAARAWWKDAARTRYRVRVRREIASEADVIVLARSAGEARQIAPHRARRTRFTRPATSFSVVREPEPIRGRNTPAGPPPRDAR